MANEPASPRHLPGICAVSSASNQFFSQTTDVQRGSPGEGFNAAKNQTLDRWLVISRNPKNIVEIYRILSSGPHLGFMVLDDAPLSDAANLYDPRSPWLSQRLQTPWATLGHKISQPQGVLTAA
jgi:hypothetical protein